MPCASSNPPFSYFLILPPPPHFFSLFIYFFRLSEWFFVQIPNLFISLPFTSSTVLKQFLRTEGRFVRKQDYNQPDPKPKRPNKTIIPRILSFFCFFLLFLFLFFFFFFFFSYHSQLLYSSLSSAFETFAFLIQFTKKQFLGGSISIDQNVFETDI